eukprot:6871199-Prymnesium_polylepis.2
MHCVSVNLTRHRVHARSLQVRRAEEDTAAHDVEEPRVLFALDCFEQVPEPYSRARGPRLATLCPMKRSDPSHNTVPMCRAGVREDAVLPCGEAIARVHRGRRRIRSRARSEHGRASLLGA